ncbi:MAG: tyrosine-type recombinase/integrase [Candidatus Hodarchaeota archaeon]
MRSFRFPHRELTVKVVPSKKELQRFYETLTNLRDKTIMLMYATSGLRASEVLRLRLDEVDFNTRTIKPEKRNSRTKRTTWISFFNRETAIVLKQYLHNRKMSSELLFPISRRWLERIFQKSSQKSGIRITPQKLREWFCTEMSLNGVNEAYIDVYCGRFPKSILGKHYLDYSYEKLKLIYERANLKVLS